MAKADGTLEGGKNLPPVRREAMKSERGEQEKRII